MVIKRYIVTICTPGDECEYTANMIASYVQEGLLTKAESQVGAAAVDAEYLDDVELLYHPDMKCGMDSVQCEEVIRKLYY